MTDLITTQQPEDGVLLLTINRPEAHNAISIEVQRDLDRRIAEAADDPGVRAIVLAGAGTRALSAGYDVHELTSITDDEHTLIQIEREELLWRWYDCPIPTVTACRGITYGAGSLYAACSDLRVGGPATTFKVTATMYGGANLTWILDQLVGTANARDILLTSRPVGGGEAAKLGLLNRHVPDEDILTTSIALAATIAANDPAAVREVKRLLLTGPGHETRSRYDAENTAMMTTIRPRPMQEIFGRFLTRKAREQETPS
jgi:enoyl-CoA hydratase/carnithine racemase